MTIFLGMDDKNEYDLFHGNWGSEYGFEIFSLKKPTSAEWKPKSPVLGAHHSPY